MIFLEIQSADFLIICERIELLRRPELDFLLNPLNETTLNYLESIFTFNEPGRSIVIYNISDVN